MSDDKIAAIDFDFAQNELMMNEFDSLNDSMKVHIHQLEAHHEKEKQGRILIGFIRFNSDLYQGEYMMFCVPVGLFVCLSVCPSFCLTVCLSDCLSDSLSVAFIRCL